MERKENRNEGSTKDRKGRRTGRKEMKEGCKGTKKERRADRKEGRNKERKLGRKERYTMKERMEGRKEERKKCH